jgi:hypothetical protein
LRGFARKQFDNPGFWVRLRASRLHLLLQALLRRLFSLKTRETAPCSSASRATPLFFVLRDHSRLPKEPRTHPRPHVSLWIHQRILLAKVG